MKHVALLFMLLLSTSAWAESSSMAASETLPVPLKQGLQRLAELSGFSCKFEQSIFYSDGSKQVYNGTLAVAKGGHFRWQYIKPYEQLYISNGDGIWLYEPDLMQAQWLQSISAVDPVAMRLLEGRVTAKEVHVLDATAGVYHLRIGDGDEAAELWLALHEKGMPVWFETRDSLDNRNRMRLLSIDEHMPDASLFEFEIPDGVDAIDANGNIMEIK
ncbi:MAG: outer-membrane lipoprotein carrier protein LolA [Mariprofundaceae bacterium]|nr:outer-membrane lipoprotein carrier protein LolA [Mariprofundaceae bacterium]